ncbi:hypothetical protein Y1Q_0018208 [Alligator mississippiensis]|uniref:Uncharacterized protein n=1 Tax=Alligator mississippiensis TaxID=8496 RepID=A0A151MR78_ALLMI|nr:hypothetical protein Y1Q_0018208 [Alligator mississippiensis]
MDWTWLLANLTTKAEEQLAEKWVCYMEDVVCEFWDRLLALKERHLEAQERQAAMLARAMEVTGEWWVLDTILALAITFVPLTAQPPRLQYHLPPGSCPPPSIKPHRSPDARVEAREKAGARDSGAGSGARRGKLSSSEEEWWSRR